MQIQGWPLPAREEAVLLAVGSPAVVGRSRQWRAQAYFLTANESIVSLSVPWGLLPKLRPGTVFVDGTPSAIKAQVEQFDITFSDPSTTLIDLAHAHGGDGRWMQVPSLLSERCVALQVDGVRIVMPCVQALRAFHAQTRLMALGALSLTCLEEIVEAELIEGVAVLTLRPLVPMGIVTKAFAQHLARLSFDPMWQASWHDVFPRRFALAERFGLDKNAAVPLECVPPVVSGDRWRGDAWRLPNGGLFIADLSGTSTQTVPPFSTVRVIHTRQPTRERARKHQAIVEAGQALASDQQPFSKQRRPKRTSRPLLVRQRLIEHGMGTRPQVVEQFPMSNRGAGTLSRNDLVSRRRPASRHDDDRLVVNLDSERASGNQQSAEFELLPGRDDLPLHFRVLIEAVEQFVKGREGLQVKYEIHALADYIPSCLPLDRFVLFIRVVMFEEVGYIVELEPLRGQPPYTLTVLPPEDGDPLTIKTVASHLNEWINRMGRSDLHALQKQSKACRVRASTHRAFGTDAWVSRVFKKLVKKSAQSSAWARGRAG